MSSQRTFFIGRGLFAGVVLLWAFFTAGLLWLMLSGLGDKAAALAFAGLACGLGIAFIADIVFVIGCLAWDEAKT